MYVPVPYVMLLIHWCTGSYNLATYQLKAINKFCYMVLNTQEPNVFILSHIATYRMAPNFCSRKFSYKTLNLKN